MSYFLKKGMETPQLVAYIVTILSIFIMNLMLASFFILIVDEFRSNFSLFSQLSNKWFWLAFFILSVVILVKQLKNEKLEVAELKRKYVQQIELLVLMIFVPLWLYIYNGKDIIYKVEPIMLLLYCLLLIALIGKLFFDYKEVMLEEIIINIDTKEYSEVKNGLTDLISKMDESNIGTIAVNEIPWNFWSMVNYQIVELKDTVDIKKLYSYETVDYKVNNQIVEVLSKENKCES